MIKPDDLFAHVNSASDAARFFGVSPAQITRWRDEGMPCKPRFYVLTEMAAWLASKLRDKTTRASDEEAELELLRRERRHIAALQRKSMEAQLIPAERVQLLMEQTASRLRKCAERMCEDDQESLCDTLDAMLRDTRQSIEDAERAAMKAGNTLVPTRKIRGEQR